MFKSRLYADSAKEKLSPKACSHFIDDLKRKRKILESYIGKKSKLRIEVESTTNCPHLEGDLLCQTWIAGTAQSLDEFKRIITREFNSNSWDCRLQSVKDMPDKDSEGHYRVITAKISVWPSINYLKLIEEKYPL